MRRRSEKTVILKLYPLKRFMTLVIPDMAPIGSKGFPPGGRPPGIMGLEELPLPLSVESKMLPSTQGIKREC